MLIAIMLAVASVWTPATVEARALAVADAWMTKALAGQAPGSASVDAPVAYVLESTAKACRSVRDGAAEREAVVAQVGKCVAETYRSLPLKGEPIERIEGWEVVPIQRLLEVMDESRDAAIRHTVAGNTLAYARFDGHQGDDMNLYLAVAPSGDVRGVWFWINSIE